MLNIEIVIVHYVYKIIKKLEYLVVIFIVKNAQMI